MAHLLTRIQYPVAQLLFLIGAGFDVLLRRGETLLRCSQLLLYFRVLRL